MNENNVHALFMAGRFPEAITQKVAAHRREQVRQIIANPRSLAAQTPFWVSEQMQTDEQIFISWEQAIHGQLHLLGHYLIETLRECLDGDFEFTGVKPKIAPMVSGVFVTPCPVCREESVPMIRVLPEEFIPPGKPFVRFVKRLRLRTNCEHQLPLDEVSWRIIENYQFLLREFR